MPVISGHNQYFLWGPQGWTGDVMVCVRGNCEGYAPHFRSRELAATFTAPWIQPDEDGIPIIVYRGLRVPVAEGWPRIKFYQ